jgi:LL-diaminopimelate aminotransferase
MKTSAQRMHHLPAHFFAALGAQIAAMQAAGYDVIRLDEGSPDLPPSPAIVAALAQAAARDDSHGYQPQRGTPVLRAAWAEMYGRVFGVELDPEAEVAPLLGSKEGIFNFMMAVVDPGDLVLVPDPGYVTYSRGALIAGGELWAFPLLPEKGFLPDLAAIPEGIAQRARILWLNYPNNPTAAVAPLSFFAEAVDFARRHDLLVCHDAAYTQITFDGRPAPSILQVPGAKEVAVEFNTLSKSHNMAGWRVGAALGHAAALRSLYTYKTNVDSGHFLPVLVASVEAMTGDQSWLPERDRIYRQRRDIVIAALHALGLPAAVPQGSLYVWCPVPGGWTAQAFAAAVLETAHVSLTPGTVFGRNGEGYVRISLTAPGERLAAAMERLSSALPQLAGISPDHPRRESWASVS